MGWRRHGARLWRSVGRARSGRHGRRARVPHPAAPEHPAHPGRRRRRQDASCPRAAAERPLDRGDGGGRALRHHRRARAAAGSRPHRPPPARDGRLRLPAPAPDGGGVAPSARHRDLRPHRGSGSPQGARGRSQRLPDQALLRARAHAARDHPPGDGVPAPRGVSPRERSAGPRRHRGRPRRRGRHGRQRARQRLEPAGGGDVRIHARGGHRPPPVRSSSFRKRYANGTSAGWRSISRRAKARS